MSNRPVSIHYDMASLRHSATSRRHAAELTPWFKELARAIYKRITAFRCYLSLNLICQRKTRSVR